MSYYLNLFSPETHDAFSKSDQTISGFRLRHRNAARRLQPGDVLVCYTTKVSRWCGLLEVVEGPFEDNTPIFYPDNDPFVVRLRVRPRVWLPLDRSVPIIEEAIWTRLSFTRDHKRGTTQWTGAVRTCLNELDTDDGRFLESILQAQMHNGNSYPIDEATSRKLATHRVRRTDKDVTVTVPENQDESIFVDSPPSEVRESIQIQALLASIGDRMGLDIWIPRNDRSGVLGEWGGDHKPILERLPLNYDETTLKTVERIDVLWLRGRSIRRAFEVEHTTSVYSGILRMADLLALQPNMDIRLHIVAPLARKDKVHDELRRPVFSLLERGPLYDLCTYLSYDSVRELWRQPSLEHMRDSVIDDYEDDPED